jgi:hypothetical protein
MKIFILCLFCFYSASIFSQILDEAKIDDIQNNIVVFQIRNDDSSNYNKYLIKGYNIRLTFDSVPNSFEIGNSKWKFFRISNDNITFTNGKMEY